MELGDIISCRSENCPPDKDAECCKKLARAESLYRVGLALCSTLRLEDTIEVVVEQAMGVVEAEAGTLWLLEEDEGGEEYLLPYVARGPKAVKLKEMRLKRGEGIAGTVVQEGRPLLVPDVQGDPRWASRFDSATGFKTRSLLCVPLSGKTGVLGCLQVLNKRGCRQFSDDDLVLASAFAAQAALAIENSLLYTNQRKLYLSLIRTLSSALDARDPYTRGHSERVSRYALLLGREIGLRRDDLELLEQAALLHDIGKIGIRDSVLLCPGPLDEDSWRELKRHPVIGASIIGEMEPKKLVCKVVKGALYHQERFDGKGYPEGKCGKEIPLFARIIAIADAFDAITSERPYRPARDFSQAISEIRRCAGSQFDPRLAEIFCEVISREYGISGCDGGSPGSCQKGGT